MNLFENLNYKAQEDGIQKQVVAAVITKENDKILILTRKGNDFMGGIDELPSGNLEYEENIYEGLVREVKEETNLSFNNIKGYINSFDYISASGKRVRQYNFIVETDEINNIKLTEHDKYMWLDIKEIRKSSKITKEVKFALEICYFNYLDK